MAQELRQKVRTEVQLGSIVFADDARRTSERSAFGSPSQDGVGCRRRSRPVNAELHHDNGLDILLPRQSVEYF